MGEINNKATVKFQKIKLYKCRNTCFEVEEEEEKEEV
jgi:hypothetical protein